MAGRGGGVVATGCCTHAHPAPHNHPPSHPLIHPPTHYCLPACLPAATERTLCCLLENYQTPEGVRVPEALQPFMMGIDFIPFE